MPAAMRSHVTEAQCSSAIFKFLPCAEHHHFTVQCVGRDTVQRAVYLAALAGSPGHSFSSRCTAHAAYAQFRAARRSVAATLGPHGAALACNEVTIDLIVKIPRTRRWRVTAYGRQVMGTSFYLREQHFPNACAKIAA